MLGCGSILLMVSSSERRSSLSDGRAFSGKEQSYIFNQLANIIVHYRQSVGCA